MKQYYSDEVKDFIFTNESKRMVDKTVKKTIQYNSGKPKLSMLDPDFIEEMAKAMMFGENKYARDNWRLGTNYSEILDGIGRHLNDRIRGKVVDDESGLSPLAHLACRAMFLYYYEKHGRGTDDLYKLDTGGES